MEREAASPIPPARGGGGGSSPASSVAQESASRPGEGSSSGGEGNDFLDEINSGTIFRPRPNSSSEGGTGPDAMQARPAGRAARDIEVIRDNLSDPSVSHNLERIRHTAREHVDSKMITCGGEQLRNPPQLPFGCPVGPFP
jgi:hypothetical protein